MRASVLASTFAASLELVREGKLEMQQSDAFSPLYMRNITTASALKKNHQFGANHG
jgi:segregation and condensation protein A